MKTKTESPKLRAARERLTEALKRMNDAADAYEANEDAEQDEALSAAFDESTQEVERASADVKRLERIAQAREDHPSPDESRDQITVVREPLTYERHNVRDSYLYDVARIEFSRGDVEGARARLARHSREIQVEVEKREKRHAEGLDVGLEELLETSGLPPHIVKGLREYGLVMKTQSRGAQYGRRERRDITRTDGAGGEFVPPLWMLEEFAEAARAGRPFADRIGKQIALPSGTDSINIPRITTGTLTGVQTADNAAVTEQDIVTASVNAPVRTIAGQIDVALQLLDQSPIGMDQILFADLLADHAMQLDTQTLNGSGASGQLLGILNVSGVNAITYTDASPTVGELYPKLGDALNQASNNRKKVPTHFWFHGRRWFWAAVALDSNGRPLFVSNAGGPNNALGSYDDAINQGGPVSYVLGVPVMLDLNVPTNLGAGTNEDRVVATVMDDHVLFEGDIRTRVLKEVLSGNLTARLQVYSYVAFTAGRFPAATSVISGTGLVAPTF